MSYPIFEKLKSAMLTGDLLGQVDAHAEIERRYDALVDAADALDAKLTECKKNIDDVFAFAQNHGMTYKGDGYGKDQESIRAVVDEAKK